MNGCTNDGVYSNPSPFGVCVTTPDHWSRRAACQPTRPPTVAKTPCNTTPRPRRKTFQRFVWSYHGRAMNPRSKQIPFWRCSCIIQLDLRVVWKSPSPPARVKRPHGDRGIIYYGAFTVKAPSWAHHRFSWSLPNNTGVTKIQWAVKCGPRASSLNALRCKLSSWNHVPRLKTRWIALSRGNDRLLFPMNPYTVWWTPKTCTTNLQFENCTCSKTIKCNYTCPRGSFPTETLRPAPAPTLSPTWGGGGTFREGRAETLYYTNGNETKTRDDSIGIST